MIPANAGGGWDQTGRALGAALVGAGAVGGYVGAHAAIVIISYLFVVGEIKRITLSKSIASEPVN